MSIKKPLTSTPNQEVISLLSNLRQEGSLASLFQRVAFDQRSESQRMFAKPLTPKAVRQIILAARQRLKHEAEQSPLAILRECKSGCNACCITPAVDVTPLEALIIAEYIKENLQGESLKQTCNRLRRNAEKRAKMSTLDRSQTRLRCGLLDDDGLCIVYEVRPLVCAGVFSLSRQSCEAAALNPQEKNSGNIPLDQPAKAAAMGVSGGLQKAIVNAGLDGNLYELNSIVHRSLETSDATNRWLRKEDIFKGCICTDRHSPPRKREKKTLRIDSPSVAEPKMIKHLNSQKKISHSAQLQ